MIDDIGDDLEKQSSQHPGRPPNPTQQSITANPKPPPMTLSAQGFDLQILIL